MKCTGCGFDEINPGGAFNVVVLLEIVSEGVDEFLSWDVLDGEECLFFLSEHWW